jgi:hypothetical protein
MSMNRRNVGADLASPREARASARSRASAILTVWGFAALVCTCSGVLAEEQVPPRREGDTSPGKVRHVAPVKPVDKAPRIGVAQRPRLRGPADELGQLGDIKALDVRDGAALFRIDGHEQTLRPGMLLKTDVIKSITPQRMVLVRPESVNEKMGETRIIVDFIGPGRNRVRMYAARDWTARRLRPAE